MSPMNLSLSLGLGSAALGGASRTPPNLLAQDPEATSFVVISFGVPVAVTAATAGETTITLNWG